MPQRPTGTSNSNSGSVQDSFHKLLYTKSIDQGGWLAIRVDDRIVTVPEFVRVSGVGEKDGRYYFTVLEGRYKGKRASLKGEYKERCLISARRGAGAKLVAKIQGRKLLRSDKRGDSSNQLLAVLYFDGKKATITLDSDVDFMEFDPQTRREIGIKHSKPLPKGTYKIRAPEAAGNAGATAFYGVNYHTVWFLVEYAPTNYSNFVHVGHLSEGCVTVYQLEMWESLYKYLISNRLDAEGKYVGVIAIE
ncbi:hypothetical protein [Cupriavidus oxalaticus]|uniref:Uncharacterized protein n=1 Tax=Cupriavidus oxalaticus TaxID=96344 RepID=A0A375G1Y5_9BURK|nr:hypothetical protein [Cupriavidus oxalaticus]QRQ88294.1 hypothetical protein JTE91_17045 [Cupriavidus oxalaticus]QRQ93379.1 hypothetical protein JTE92_25215 [Cupriavidus oxalaticus]WQD82000.1 hypothetical protein U0036_12960 [Cupriavidus oxalaticus]SPC13580.1 conserved hypothetical protein [Cupriavidus oxalaticus]